MAISNVKICNLALAKLGALQIAALTDDSEEAILCNLFFEPIRDALLREHPWNFAAKRIALAQLSSDPLFGYDYAYAKPSDCIHARQVVNPTTGADSEFVVEGNQVFTDVEDAYLIYTGRVTDPTLFDPNFVQALYGRLGAEICENITGTTTKVQAMTTLYLNAMAKAKAADSAEGKDDPTETDPWLTARGIADSTADFYYEANT